MKRYYTWFPGCSCAHGGAKAYGASALAVAKALDVDLIELEDWNCCGSTPYSSIDEVAAMCAAARNLALAEKKGLDMVTPCSCCITIMKRADAEPKKYPELKKKIDACLAAGALEYHGTVKVRHLLDVLANDVGYKEMAAAVKVKLGDLKVAPYYGCQVVRPTPSFDDPENPQTLDRLVESIGAKPVPYPLKARCCGGSLMMAEEEIGLDLVHKLLEDAARNGADLIVTVCPLCQTNLDVFQSAVNKKFKTNFKLPVLFFTQLMGIAFGVDRKSLALGACIISPEKALAKATAGAKGG